MTRLTSLSALTVLFVSTFASPAHADGKPASEISVDEKKAWSALDGIEQFAILANTSDSDSSSYVADALEDQLTALGRMGFVTQCLKSYNPVLWAICQPDVDAFDPAKALGEIKADTKHQEWERAAMKAAVEAYKGALSEHATKVKATMEKDTAYKKMFEIASSTRKAFASTQGKELRALTLTMDDARTTRSRKALEGCEDKVWTAWKTAVSAIPAKRFSLAYKDMITEVFEPAAATIAGDPNGYLAAVALGACFGEKPDMLVKYVRHALLFWPGFRGPRNAAHLALVQANLTLDDRDAKLKMPQVDRRSLFTGNGNGGDLSNGGYARAPIVSVKASGPLTHVTFGPTKTKETQCTDYRPGKRLSRIESDGRLVYEGSCGKYAQVMVDHDPPKPVDTPSRYAAAVKVGMIATVVEQALLLAQPNLTATAPSVVFGAPVK